MSLKIIVLPRLREPAECLRHHAFVVLDQATAIWKDCFQKMKARTSGTDFAFRLVKLL